MEREVDVLFVCLHGSAKSVIAAELLRRLAAERGLAVVTASAGVEPDATIPPHVVAGLGAERIDVSTRLPRQVSGDLLASATRIVSFGCDLSAVAPTSCAIERWDDVPAVSDGYAAARDTIVSRLHALLDEIGARRYQV
jgi:arsenate reductase